MNAFRYETASLIAADPRQTQDPQYSGGFWHGISSLHYEILTLFCRCLSSQLRGEGGGAESGRPLDVYLLAFRLSRISILSDKPHSGKARSCRSLDLRPGRMSGRCRLRSIASLNGNARTDG
jgi:hypothetical protein